MSLVARSGRRVAYLLSTTKGASAPAPLSADGLLITFHDGENLATPLVVKPNPAERAGRLRGLDCRAVFRQECGEHRRIRNHVRHAKVQNDVGWDAVQRGLLGALLEHHSPQRL